MKTICLLWLFSAPKGIYVADLTTFEKKAICEKAAESIPKVDNKYSKAFCQCVILKAKKAKAARSGGRCDEE